MFVAGIPTILLSQFIYDDKLLLHFSFALCSIIFILLIYWKNRFCKRIKYNLHITTKPLIIILLGIIIIFHIGIIIPIFYVLLSFMKNVDESFSIFTIENMIFALIFAPIIEEIIFRVIMLSGLMMRYTPIKSIIISALFFASIHIDPTNIYIGKIITAFLLGFLSGWIFYKTQNLGLCIVLHSFSNFMVFVTAFLGKFILNVNLSEILKINISYVVVFFSLFLVSVLTYYMKKNFKLLN